MKTNPEIPISSPLGNRRAETADVGRQTLADTGRSDHMPKAAFVPLWLRNSVNALLIFGAVLTGAPFTQGCTGPGGRQIVKKEQPVQAPVRSKPETRAIPTITVTLQSREKANFIWEKSMDGVGLELGYIRSMIGKGMAREKLSEKENARLEQMKLKYGIRQKNIPLAAALDNILLGQLEVVDYYIANRKKLAKLFALGLLQRPKDWPDANRYWIEEYQKIRSALLKEKGRLSSVP